MIRRLAVALGALSLAALAWTADPPEQPRDVGLMEQTSTRLAQLDVTVSGPRDAIVSLTAADFEVRLNDKLVQGVLLDDLCVMPPPTPRKEQAAEAVPVAPPAAAAASAQAAARPPAATATYLLYFDMPHLTQAGRRTSIDSARAMLPRLLAGGHRAMIVANAADLKTVVPLTGDLAKLDAALARMIDDNGTFDVYASTEENRLAEVIHEMSRGVDYAVSLARRYATEERWRQERDLRRLSMVLGRFEEIDPPKAALYFSDTMRQNAGEHYLSLFGDAVLKDAQGRPESDAAAVLADAATGVLPLDKVINEAASHGIRFYTIEGEGIQAPTSFIQARGSASTDGVGQGRGNNASPGLATQRNRDAQGTLVSLAAETGGRAFLNRVAPARIAGQILDDMSCVYLLSFDPRQFPQDTPLAVSVSIHRPKVKATVRGRLVIQSESVRLTSRVLSAFAAPSAKESESPVRVGLIPIGYKDGRYTARVQVSIPGSAVPGATWDLGASLVSRGVVWQDGSGRVQVAAPYTPVVFERDMEFSPGEFDLVAVAHEITTDTLASKELHGSWPKIDTERATLGPIAVSQPLRGGFLRNGETRVSGAVVVGDGEPVRSDAPTAVVTLVCRAKDQKKPLQVSRTLIGETETPVGSTTLDLATERCAQVLDLIPAKTLGVGSYRFVVAVSSEGTELARGEKPLFVPETAPGSKPKGAS